MGGRGRGNGSRGVDTKDGSRGRLSLQPAGWSVRDGEGRALDSGGSCLIRRLQMSQKTGEQALPPSTMGVSRKHGVGVGGQ